MRRRCLELIGVVLMLMAVVVLLQVGSMSAAGQARPTGTAPKTRSMPATLWGEPDLQGIWAVESQVPLQRPGQYGNREFFTEAEIAALDRQRAAMKHFGDRVAAQGTVQDVAGAYNSFWVTIKRTGRRTSLIVDPPDGRLPPVTPEVQKRRKETQDYRLALLQATDACRDKIAGGGCDGGIYGPPSPRRAEVPPSYLTQGVNRADNPEDRGSQERCLYAQLPDFGSAIQAYYLRIVQSPGFVSIYYDTYQGQGWQRVIPITTAPHLPPHVRQWWGDSRGHWEDKTLVVDVTNFSLKTDFQGSRDNLHIVERFTRTDANTLEYIVTSEDPTTWTRPWTVKQELIKQSDQGNRIYYEPRCHEGNYGMVALLAGSRAEERAFAEGRGPDPATLCISGCGPTGGEENQDPLR